MTRSSNLASTTPGTLALAAALAGAGLIHCLLTREHMAMSVIFGVGFLAAGVGQLGMAGLAIVRPSRVLYAAVIASTVALSSMYAYNVLVGLPFHDDAAPAAAGTTEEDHDDESGAHGTGHSEQPAPSQATRGSADAHPSREAGSFEEASHSDGDDHEESAATDHHEDGLVIGGGEPVDAYGALTQAAQLTAAAIAAALLGRSRRPTV